MTVVLGWLPELLLLWPGDDGHAHQVPGQSCPRWPITWPLPLLFGMVALAAFGVVVNLLPKKMREGDSWPRKTWLFGLGGSLAVVVLGNLGELQLILQGLNTLGGPGFPSKIPGLSGLVTEIKGLFKVLGGARLPFRPEWWYWNAAASSPTPFNEFPDFSFLYADLHAHLLAMPSR